MACFLGTGDPLTSSSFYWYTFELSMVPICPNIPVEMGLVVLFMVLVLNGCVCKSILPVTLMLDPSIFF